jgi:cyanophycin synthetase
MHLREAQRRGWVVQSLRLGFYPALLLGAGRHAHLLVMNVPAHVSAPLTLAGINKGTARDLLAAYGLPVAAGAVASSPSAALRAARRIGGPVVIKRLVGGNSDGVIVGVSQTRDVTSAAAMLLAGNQAVLVESAVTGVELRLHFLSGKLHRAFRADPYWVTGDGHRSLTDLVGERYPRYLRVMSSSGAHRRRLVMCLWPLGVRTIADVDRVVPALGHVVRISAATGAGMERVEAADFIPKRDIARIERFLTHHGSPSCGVDVIVRTPGAPFDEGGVILELNIPCGFGYLDDPKRAVAADLRAAIAGDAGFRRDKGRVPVWLVMEEEGKDLARRAEMALRKREGRVAVGALAVEQSNWVSHLNQPDVEALLITVSEDTIRAHGVPVNLAPALVCEGDRAAFARRFPVTWQTVKQAKGRLMRAPR